MPNPRIIDNQRRTALMLVDALARRLTPGLPFLPELRATLAANKGFGSRDRRIYRELVFTWLRYRPWFDRVRAADPARAVDLLVALASDAPELATWQVSLDVAGGIAGRTWPEFHERLVAFVPGMEFALRDLMPAWFERQCPALFADAEVLTQLTRPPFWLRAQRGTADELVRELALTQVTARTDRRVPGAVRVADYVDLEQHLVVTSGRAEIQDIGSQALLVMAAPAPGERWLDLCAGAGGKSLQLAGMLGPAGRVTAHDVRRDALMELRRRLLRAEMKNIVIEPVLPEAGPTQFDGVLVDAPCSASGTWRRHPFLRHQLTAATVVRYAGEQLALLQRGGDYVRPGGRLIYATCSLARRENEDVVTAFLKDRRDFTLEPPAVTPEGAKADRQPGWVTLLPSMLDSDGYFLACLRRQ